MRCHELRFRVSYGADCDAFGRPLGSLALTVPCPTLPSIDLALEDPELMFCGATAGEFIFSFVRAIRLMMSCLVFRFFPERRDTPGRLRGFNRVGVWVLSGMFQNVGMQRVGTLRERRRTVHRRGRQRAVLADERTGIRSIRPG